jgi:hypothetical protein
MMAGSFRSSAAGGDWNNLSPEDALVLEEGAPLGILSLFVTSGCVNIPQKQTASFGINGNEHDCSFKTSLSEAYDI